MTVSRAVCHPLPLLLALVALVGSLLGPPATASPEPEPRPLGVPLQDVLLIGGTVGSLADGRSVIWSAASGTPASLHAIDPTTGEPLQSFPLPGAGGSYAVEQAPDGSVYVGTYGAGRLFRLAPGATQVEDLGVPVAGEAFVWTIVVAPDSTVWGGTSPGGKIFSFDPGTGAFTDHGQAAPGQTYVKSIAWHDGKVYAGGYADWVVTEYDPATGTKRQLPLPPGLTDPTLKTVNDLRVRGDVLYARGYSAFPGPLYLYDLTNGRWTQTIEGAAGLDVSPRGPDGRVWFLRQYEPGSTELVGLDPGTGEIERTGYRVYGRVANSRGIGWAEVDADGYPGPSLVGLLWRGLMFRYNPETGSSDSVRTSIPGNPTEILALTEGFGRDVWVGGFLQGGLARVDLDTGETEYERFSQIESLLEHDGKLLIGAYPDARLYRYDPDRPWYSPEYSDTPPTGEVNPVKLLDLKTHDQSRPQGLTMTAGRIVTGSTPANDTLGGTLAVLDEDTGEVEAIHDDLIVDEAIVSLTSAREPGVVFGSTSTAGGLSTTPPTQPNATVFAFDVVSGRLLWEVNPSPSAQVIPVVRTDRSGRIWAIVDGDILLLDPRTGGVLHRIDTSPTASSTGALDFADRGRTAYALLQGSRVVHIDTATGRWRELFSQPARRMVHHRGELVFAVGAELIAVRVDGPRA